MSFDIEKFVLIDNHAHSILRNHLELDEIGFRRCFSESRSLSVLQNHMPKSIHYIYLLDHLERIFNVASEQEFLSFRMKQPGSEFVQVLFDDVSLGAIILDDGFAKADFMTVDELARVSRRPVFHCLRVEKLMEDCLLESGSFAELKREYFKRLIPKSKHRTVSLKTICAYRGGLSLLDPDESEAKKDYELIKKELEQSKTNSSNGRFRISKRPLYHYLLLETFERAAEALLPVQVHSGIGDDDANLIDSNPALMQPVLRQERFRQTSFVFLHCFPYVREAAFLCSLYNNVYMDLSLSISLASSNSQGQIQEALCLAPASKILAGTDGHSCPESHWYGALNWKRGLSFALHQMINSGIIKHREAEEIAALILHDNAITLYQLEGLA